jgi:thiol:disulfide interchange protein DsbD
LLQSAPPADAKQSAEAQISAGAPPSSPAQTGEWAHLKPRYLQPGLEVGGLLKAIVLGMLAGLVLNFMPCVLPVISLKLSALMAGAAQDSEARRKRAFREHNLFFALGILLYFLALSVILGATGLAWGQLFQRPGLVLGMAALVFALSLSMFGVFNLPVVDLKIGGAHTHPRRQALFTGVVATLLATPCSGPFLGGVLGWTLLQPGWVIAVVLAAIGLGMALPYLIMALAPGLGRRFPKPGPWTGHLEHAVGFLLMATCVYLLSILPVSRIMPALVLLWCTGASAWLWGSAGPGFDSRKAVVLKLCSGAMLALGLFLALRPAAPPAPLDDFDAAALRESLGKQAVVVDFTADWCPSCKALEQTVLTPARLEDMKKRYGLTLMRADLTEPNPRAEALLHALGSQSIPALAIFPKDAPDRPLVLRDLFTAAQLTEALEQTASPQ